MGLNYLPISINISGKKILIVGGGKVGYHKAQIISRFAKNVTVVSPKFHEGFDDLPFNLIQKEYEPYDLQGVFLVYICTENETLNANIKRDAETAGILASVCDNPALCDFISPAIHKTGNITIAVSSDGQNVRQAIAIRNQISELIDNKTISI